ncbi:MAG: 50S ribosomal protein L22 [Candidatus Omnitrophica bacterium]|nr:50S ribosomal protein L22 [Candidatus Omnitrophota bacterium]MBU4487532.1 50S ribosomal protein L22 [Candidatus Omnitrophota bacterium]MCG2705772.1 50S ribosomal protein L22 [Candidatus Omnitrophota bacterium]
MIAKAVTKYVRIPPRKAMLVTRPLKGLSVPRAYALLAGIKKKAARFINLTLRSAVANAHKKDQHLDESDLYISRITADGGPMLKRFRAGSMGRAFTIRKRTCHLTVQLDVKEKPNVGIPSDKKSAKSKAVQPKAARPKDVKPRPTKPATKRERR